MSGEEAATAPAAAAAKLFAGRWTKDEEAYTDALIKEFRAGSLPDVPEGSTLRNFLADAIGCHPKRISKKYEGTDYNGRQQYWRNTQFISDEEAMQRLNRLDELRVQFKKSREASSNKKSRRSLSRSKKPAATEGKRPGISRSKSEPSKLQVEISSDDDRKPAAKETTSAKALPKRSKSLNRPSAVTMAATAMASLKASTSPKPDGKTKLVPDAAVMELLASPQKSNPAKPKNLSPQLPLAPTNNESTTTTSPETKKERVAGAASYLGKIAHQASAVALTTQTTKAHKKDVHSAARRRRRAATINRPATSRVAVVTGLDFLGANLTGSVAPGSKRNSAVLEGSATGGVPGVSQAPSGLPGAQGLPGVSQGLASPLPGSKPSSAALQRAVAPSGLPGAPQGLLSPLQGSKPSSTALQGTSPSALPGAKLGVASRLLPPSLQQGAHASSSTPSSLPGAKLGAATLPSGLQQRGTRLSLPGAKLGAATLPPSLQGPHASSSSSSPAALPGAKLMGAAHASLPPSSTNVSAPPTPQQTPKAQTQDARLNAILRARAEAVERQRQALARLNNTAAPPPGGHLLGGLPGLAGRQAAAASSHPRLPGLVGNAAASSNRLSALGAGAGNPAFSAAALANHRLAAASNPPPAPSLPPAMDAAALLRRRQELVRQLTANKGGGGAAGMPTTPMLTPASSLPPPPPTATQPPPQGPNTTSRAELERILLAGIPGGNKNETPRAAANSTIPSVLPGARQQRAAPPRPALAPTATGAPFSARDLTRNIFQNFTATPGGMAAVLARKRDDMAAGGIPEDLSAVAPSAKRSRLAHES